MRSEIWPAFGHWQPAISSPGMGLYGCNKSMELSCVVLGSVKFSAASTVRKIFNYSSMINDIKL